MTPVRRAEPETARVPQADAPSRPAATPEPAILALQRSAGNQAVARYLAQAGGPVLARDPPPPVLPPTVDEAQLQAVHTAVTGALTEAITGRGVIADAVVAAKTMVRGDPTLQPVPAELEARIDQLGAIKATTGLSSFDYVSAGVALQDALSAGGAVALADVFGPGLYARRVGSQAGTFLAGAIGDPNGKDLDVKAMSQQLQNLLDELDDRSALFQLELDGTIERIASLRATIAATRHEATRKSLYAELAVLARRALQLNAAAKRVEAEDAKGTPPLGMALAKVGPEIAAIRQSSQTEKASLTAMGDDVGLLRDKELDYAGRWEAASADTVVHPAGGGVPGGDGQRDRQDGDDPRRPRLVAGVGGLDPQEQGHPDGPHVRRPEGGVRPLPGVPQPRRPVGQPARVVRPRAVRGHLRRHGPRRRRGRRHPRADDALVGGHRPGGDRAAAARLHERGRRHQRVHRRPRQGQQRRRPHGRALSRARSAATTRPATRRRGSTSPPAGPPSAARPTCRRSACEPPARQART